MKGDSDGKLFRCKQLKSQNAIILPGEFEMSPFAEASTERMSDAEVDRESATMPFTDSELAQAFPNAGVGACGKKDATSPCRRDAGESVAAVEPL
jgi:hypothetical protein